MTINTLSVLAKEYGRDTFVLGILLAAWFSFARPLMDDKKLDWEKHQQTMGVLEDISDSQLDASRSIESASASIASASQSLRETASVLKEVASQLTVTK